MQKSKLYTLLKKFDKYEQNRLRKFLRSPYFNRNERLVKLFDLLAKDVNAELEKISIERDKIWDKIGHKGDYDDVRLRKDFSDLLRLTEKFIAQEQYEKNELYEAEFLLKGIHEKKLVELEKGTMKMANRLLNRFPLQSSDYYYHKFSIEKNYFLLNQNVQVKSEKKNIEAVSNNLDIFYICEKLRYYCYVIGSKRISTHQYELRMMEQIINQVENSDLKEIPAIAIYYQNYLTLVDRENEAHYFKLKSLLDQYGLSFPKEEAFILYSSTLNYCVRKINSGSPNFLQEYLDIIMDFLEKEIIFLDNYLEYNVYNNIIITALRLEKFDWVEEFIPKYIDRIKPESRENTYTFNMARLYWYRKDHQKVIELLRSVEYEYIVYNLVSKTLLLTTYYDTDEIEPLYSLLESFRAFLNRHKEIPQHRRNYYLNLIRVTKKMTNIIPGDKKAIEKIRNEVNENSTIATDPWLKEKLAELD